VLKESVLCPIAIKQLISSREALSEHHVIRSHPIFMFFNPLTSLMLTYRAWEIVWWGNNTYSFQVRGNVLSGIICGKNNAWCCTEEIEQLCNLVLSLSKQCVEVFCKLKQLTP
jgi:hypothetical protein